MIRGICYGHQIIKMKKTKPLTFTTPYFIISLYFFGFFRGVYIYVQNSDETILPLWMVYDVEYEFFGSFKRIQHTKYEIGKVSLSWIQ